MQVHFDYMKKKLSVRAFKEYVDSGTRLSFRAFDPTWGAIFPSDAKRARKLLTALENKLRQDAYAEALLLSNGDAIEAEYMLIKQLIAPPSFTAVSNCRTCGILPARQTPQGIEPSCSWCGLISDQEQEL